MKKKNNVAVKVLAILALLWIIISIIGTALLVITSGGQPWYGEVEPTDFQDLISTDNIQITTASWETITASWVVAE